MYQRPQAPRSIGGVLDDAIRLYRESFRSIWPILLAAAILAMLPGILFAMNGVYSQTPADQARAFAQLTKSPNYWLTIFVLSVVNLIMYGALFGAIDAVARGGELRFGAALKLGVARFPRLFAASILFGLMVAVGFMLLVIPGIYLLGLFQLVFVAIVLEDAGMGAAFGVSRRLIKGHWWRSTTILTVAFIILLVLSLLASVAVAGFAALRASLPTIMLVNQIVSGILDLFLVGWFPCVLLALYYDLKLRHEGADLATRVGALA
jgi:hypothetical protein